ncbi:MAG: NADP-dependent malic enzyme [bacterium]|nr:NADP-dependent malic enzyme [bacterium]
MATLDKNAILAAHEGGKITMASTRAIRSREDLSVVYTPGVAEVSRAIAADPTLARRYTISGRCVAVISDGSAVLGLGNVGPRAAMPVMEGKCAIFKEFAGLDAFPIVLDVHDADGIIAAVRAIAPTFAAVNLEDIAAPTCFAVEERLQDLGIPVMHDDQHGTAVVVLAALLNAGRVVEKELARMRVVVVGAGAAGTAIAHMLAPRVADVVLADSHGLVCAARDDLNAPKRALLAVTNKRSVCGTLADALHGADVFIGVSKAGLLSPALVASMAPRSIVIAMANPVPEIMPDEARAAGAMVVATGRSDFPNQVNNALAYPGIFLGAINAGATRITDAMKLAAAQTIAGFVEVPAPDIIIPSIFSPDLARTIADAVARAWDEEHAAAPTHQASV